MLLLNLDFDPVIRRPLLLLLNPNLDLTLWESLLNLDLGMVLWNPLLLVLLMLRPLLLLGFISYWSARRHLLGPLHGLIMHALIVYALTVRCCPLYWL